MATEARFFMLEVLERISAYFSDIFSFEIYKDIDLSVITSKDFKLAAG